MTSNSFSYKIRDVWRTIKIWWLLRKLNAELLEQEATEPEHAKKTGHAYTVRETQAAFIERIAKGNPKKVAVYNNYLSIADKKMHFMRVDNRPMHCADCGCATGPKTSWIRLNDAGLEFIGVFDLAEYILAKYKLTWGLLVTIFLSPIWVPLLSNHILQPVCVILQLCHG
jgi:hypothetical protein